MPRASRYISIGTDASTVMLCLVTLLVAPERRIGIQNPLISVISEARRGASVSLTLTLGHLIVTLNVNDTETMRRHQWCH